MALAELLLWLCEVHSPIGEERELCDLLLARLNSLDLPQPIARYGDSLVVPLSRGTGGPHIVLAGHLDVVRTEHEGKARIEGDRLYGAGAADMKSGLALMLSLATRRAHAGVDLSLIFYAREEGPYAENELGLVLSAQHGLGPIDLAVCLEPSDNKLQLGCSGSVQASVRFLGKTAHSARPWQGENAIHKAHALLERLSKLQPEPVEVDGLTYVRVTSATLAQGGRARNIIPDAFELNLNHRFGPDSSLPEACARVQQLAMGEAQVEFVDLSPAALPHRHHPLVKALAESGVRAIEPKQAWTDVARFAQLGVVAVNFGPGTQSQAHQKNEWTFLPDLEVGERILDTWLAKIRVES